jgi:hypothetical protein
VTDRRYKFKLPLVAATHRHPPSSTAIRDFPVHRRYPQNQRIRVARSTKFDQIRPDSINFFSFRAPRFCEGHFSHIYPYVGIFRQKGFSRPTISD